MARGTESLRRENQLLRRFVPTLLSSHSIALPLSIFAQFPLLFFHESELQGRGEGQQQIVFAECERKVRDRGTEH